MQKNGGGGFLPKGLTLKVLMEFALQSERMRYPLNMGTQRMEAVCLPLKGDFGSIQVIDMLVWTYS